MMIIIIRRRTKKEEKEEDFIDIVPFKICGLPKLHVRDGESCIKLLIEIIYLNITQRIISYIHS